MKYEDLLFIEAHEERIATVNALLSCIIKNKKKYNRLKKKQTADHQEVIREGDIHYAKSFID